jgi:hypothetical protein
MAQHIISWDQDCPLPRLGCALYSQQHFSESEIVSFCQKKTRPKMGFLFLWIYVGRPLKKAHQHFEFHPTTGSEKCKKKITLWGSLQKI